MTLQIDFWQLLTFSAGLLLAFLSAAFGMGRMLLGQVEKRLDTRFLSLERAAQEESSQWRRVERELLDLRAELPLHYVRREDYIRGQSVIEAKLDGLALRIENHHLKGTQR
jgi:hypothetical protein